MYWCQPALQDTVSMTYYHTSLTKSLWSRVLSTDCQKATIKNSCKLFGYIIAIWSVLPLRIYPFVSLLVFRINYLLTIIAFWRYSSNFGMSLKAK